MLLLLLLLRLLLQLYRRLCCSLRNGLFAGGDSGLSIRRVSALLPTPQHQTARIHTEQRGLSRMQTEASDDNATDDADVFSRAVFTLLPSSRCARHNMERRRSNPHHRAHVAMEIG
jgi:hypothetical protein